MVKKFEFKDNALELDIAGSKFNIELTAELIAASDDLKTAAGKYAAELSQSGAGAKDLVEKTCEFLANGIDSLLGEGAAKTIFGDRAVTLLDLADVMNFVQSEIGAKVADKTAEYNRSGRSNRRSRRANKVHKK